jgi:hypothetical protein
MNEQGLYDIYDVWHQPWWQKPFVFLILIIVVLLILLVTIWYLFKRYRLNMFNRKKTPWQQALDDLDVLRRHNKTDVLHGKEFYLRVTEILKHYIQGRYKLDVQGKTDNECIMYLETTDVPRDLVADLRAIFQGSEMIKFANAQAAQDQIEQDFVRSKNMIQRTMPKAEKK